MTSYSVEWTPEADDLLADIWINAPDRQAVTRAQATIDRLLSHSPKTAGSHISEGLYHLHVVPLRVAYSIDEDQKIVEVSWAWFRP